MKNIKIKKLLLTVLAAGLWVACTESGSSSAEAEEGIWACTPLFFSR